MSTNPEMSRRMLREARRYLAEDRVLSVYIGSQLVSLTVLGSTGKHTVMFDLRLKKYSCSCWGFTVHKKCKHVLCALLYLKLHHPEVYAKLASLLNLQV